MNVQSEKDIGIITENVSDVTVLPDSGYDAMESVKYSVEIPIESNVNTNLELSKQYYIDNVNQYGNLAVSKEIVPSSSYTAMEKNTLGFHLLSRTIDSNGSYNIYDYRAGGTQVGWWNVTVNVPQGENVNNADAGTNGVVTANGQYNIPTGYTGFNSFEVAVPIQNDRSMPINIGNGWFRDVAPSPVQYTRNIIPSSGYVGQKNVTINFEMLHKTIDSNGSYNIINYRSNEHEVGWYQVDVNVPTTLVDNANVNANNNITSNGTFTVPNDKTGFNSFTVNVPQGVPSSSIENTKSITLYRNYSSEPYVLEPDTNYEALRECQIYVQVPSDINNANVGTNGVISTNGTYTIPTGKSGWNSFSVNVPQTVQGVDPLDISFVNSGLGNHPFHSYMYTENVSGEYIYIEPKQYAELWIEKSNGDVEFVVYYYKGTGSRYPLTNTTSCYYQRYTPSIPPLSEPNPGDTVKLQDSYQDDILTINWYERYFSGTNMPGLLTASITFPSALVGSTFIVPFFNN